MSEKCLRFINALEAEVKRYEEDHEKWRETLAELIRQRDAAKLEFDKADIELSQIQPNSHNSRKRWEGY
jgi:hypothetical protein